MRVPSGLRRQRGVLVVPQLEHCWPAARGLVRLSFSFLITGVAPEVSVAAEHAEAVDTCGSAGATGLCGAGFSDFASDFAAGLIAASISGVLLALTSLAGSDWVEAEAAGSGFGAMDMAQTGTQAFDEQLLTRRSAGTREETGEHTPLGVRVGVGSAGQKVAPFVRDDWPVQDRGVRHTGGGWGSALGGDRGSTNQRAGICHTMRRVGTMATAWGREMYGKEAGKRRGRGERRDRTDTTRRTGGAGKAYGVVVAPAFWSSDASVADKNRRADVGALSIEPACTGQVPQYGSASSRTVTDVKIAAPACSSR